MARSSAAVRRPPAPMASSVLPSLPQPVAPAGAFSRNTAKSPPVSPRPATVDIRAEEVGYRAMVRLASRMRNPEETPLVVRVAAKIVPAGAEMPEQ